MNKDNFWNLMFFFVNAVCIFLSQLVADMIPIGKGLFLAVTTIAVPYLLFKFNKVTFQGDKIHTSNGRIISKLKPENIWFVVWGAFTFSKFVLDNLLNRMGISFDLYNIISFWFILTLYFIVINYPINLLFNKKAFVPQSNIRSRHNKYSDIHSSNHFNDRNNSGVLSLHRLTTDPINSWHSSNIYHHRNHR
jgi:hypothetical protein